MLRLLVHEANVPNWVFWRFAADIEGVRRAGCFFFLHGETPAIFPQFECRSLIGQCPVSGRETLSQLVFVLALHFVQHLDGSPPGHGQPVQTHCCSYLQPQRWPTSAHVMSSPGPDDKPGPPALPAPEAAAEDATTRAGLLR